MADKKTGGEKMGRKVVKNVVPNRTFKGGAKGTGKK